MFVGQVEKKRKYTIVYKFCLVNKRIALLFNQLSTNQYIVFLKYGLYPKNKKGVKRYEKSNYLCKTHYL